MAEPPLTRVTLLNRLRDGRDGDAWREFIHLYGPVVYGFARNRGLQDADAADLMQEVLRSIARNAARMEYDPKRGTFRGWLYTVTRNKIYNFLNGYVTAMPHEEFLHLHLHELLTYLNQQGVMTVMILAQHGLFGPGGAPMRTRHRSGLYMAPYG